MQEEDCAERDIAGKGVGDHLGGGDGERRRGGAVQCVLVEASRGVGHDRAKKALLLVVCVGGDRVHCNGHLACGDQAVDDSLLSAQGSEGVSVAPECHLHHDDRRRWCAEDGETHVELVDLVERIVIDVGHQFGQSRDIGEDDRATIVVIDRKVPDRNLCHHAQHGRGATQAPEQLAIALCCDRQQLTCPCHDLISNDIINRKAARLGHGAIATMENSTNANLWAVAIWRIYAGLLRCQIDSANIIASLICRKAGGGVNRNCGQAGHID
mmetsp:Transcript_26890/g.59098  ORF Transcript_26890/g.59098 Transcript_26890/m.59098 type:complete len:269 (-) Transcript_26890:391-1197(-)